MKLLLIISSLLGLISYKPKDMVVEVGIGNDELLQINDYLVTNNNVNWDVEGSYQVEYYHNQSQASVLRNVYIIPTNFENYSIRSNILMQNADAEIMQMLETDDGYYLCGTIPSYDPYKISILEQKYGYITCLSNNTTKWQLTFLDGYSYVSSIVIYKGILYALLTSEKDNGTSLKLLEIRDGKIKKELIITNNLITYGSKLILIDKRLFVICSTNTNTPPLSYIDECEYIGILELDLHDLSVINSQCCGNIGINKILELDFDDNNIAIVVAIEGTSGFFKNLNNEYSGNFLIILDLDLQLKEYRYLNHMNIKSLFITPLDYCVLAGNEDGIKAWLDIIILNRSFPYEAVYRCNIPGERISIQEIKHTKTTEGRHFLGVNIYRKDIKKNEHIGIVEFTNNYDLKETIFYPTNTNNFSIDCMFYSKRGSLLLVGTYNNTLKIEEFIGLLAKTSDNFIYDDIKYRKARVYINGRQVGILGESDKKLFGYHEDLINLNDIVDIYLMNRYYNPADINIKSNQVYDIGVILNFNGRGILNGEEIDNGYCIQEVGEYSLIVQGSGEERHIVNFRVDALSLGDKQAVTSEFKLGKAVLVPSITQKQKISFENYLLSYREDTGIIITIIIILSFIVLGIFPKIKQRKKQK